MNGQYPCRAARRRRSGRPMVIIMAAMLVVCLFVQITMLARISSGNKQISKVQREITELSANAENLQRSINQHHNLEEIAVLASRLGMQRPDATQIRVVSVAYDQNNPTYSAEAIGEEIRN